MNIAELEARVARLEKELNKLSTLHQGNDVQNTGASDPPTFVNIGNAFGTKFSGFIGTMNDFNNSKVYLVAYVGATRHYVLMTQAV